MVTTKLGRVGEISYKGPFNEGVVMPLPSFPARPWWTVHILACCLWSVIANARGPERKISMPNVILCMADDLGWGDVGFNGSAIARTPHLDVLAAQGMILRRFYAAAPVCSPTRGSVLTGRHPYRYGIYFANVGHLPQRETTLPELLHKQGYATGFFGKWHLGTLTREIRDSNRGGVLRHREHFSPPNEHGFLTYFATEAKVPTYDPLRAPRDKHDHRFWKPLMESHGHRPYGTAYWSHGKVIEENLAGDDSRVIMDRVIPFVEKAVAEEEPFLAVVWFHAPHWPVVAGEQDQTLYRDLDDFSRQYFGCITALDRQMGRLWNCLETLGVADHTMLWFCSDNGPEGRTESDAPGSAGPFRGRKRSLYEGGVRVPAFVVWPRVITPGQASNFPASTSDYLPTILDVLGLSVPDDCPLDGTSLFPLLRGEMPSSRSPIGFVSGQQVAWSGPRYKLIHVPTQGTRQRLPEGEVIPDPTSFQLFDLVADPSETHDQAEAHPETVKSMQQDLQQWLTSLRRSQAGEDYAD